MTQIILDGVDEDKRRKAEAEISHLLDDFFSGKENPVDSIRVTKEFQKAIQDLLNEEETKYDPHHEYGTAYAKTIPFIKQKRLRFAIILDGNLIGRWTNEEYVSRIATLTHELVHVTDDKRRWSKIGTEEFFSKPKGKKEWLFHNAWITWQEYKANRVVAEVIEETAKQLKGEVNYGFALGHAKTLSDLLEDVHGYIRQKIRDFRYWRLTPTEICYQVTSRICAILLLCSYVYALVDLSDEVKQKIEEIESLEGYRFLLSDDWPKIHSVLKKFYSKAKKYLPELVDEIGNEIDVVVERCGLQIRDAKEGFSVDVRDIE